MIDAGRTGHATDMEGSLDRPGDSGPLVDEDRRATRFHEVVVAQHTFAHRSLRRLGVSAASVDDALQALWVVVHRRLDDIDEGSERSFIFGAAMRIAADDRRSRARKREIAPDEIEDLPADSADPEASLEDARARAVLDSMLLELPMELRAVFVLFEIEEVSTPAIARMLDLPLGTATSRLRRAREHFEAIVKRRRARGSL